MGAVGSFGIGGDASYHTSQVGAGAGGTEYYSGAVSEHGEEAGRWMGAGAAALGLTGQVDAKDMLDLYGRGLDPRDPKWSDPATRDQAARFGSAPRSFRSAEELLAEKVAAEPGALPERVEELRVEAERAARHAVPLMDVTFSPSKDITVARTAFAWAEQQARAEGDTEKAAVWAEKRATLEQGERLGNEAFVQYLQDHAYVRVGAGSGGLSRWVDADGLTVASFYQRTSRAGDPQDHFHNVILPKAVSPDGKVLAVDTTVIRDAMRPAAAFGARVMSEHHAKHLGLRLEQRTDKAGREFVAVDQAAKDLFSSSARRISPKVEAWKDDYRAKFGREPLPLEISRASHAIHLSQRASKSSLPLESRIQELERWDGELRAEVAGGMRRVAEQLGAESGRVLMPDSWSPSGVIAEAVAACQERSSTWDEGTLFVEVERALPDYLGITDPVAIRALIQSHVDAALNHPGLVRRITGHAPVSSVPADMRLANGASGYQRPGGVRYADASHVASEYALRESAVVRGRLAADSGKVAAQLARIEQTAGKLGVDQAAAVRGIATSGAAVSVLVGPAGAGKSTTLGALAVAWPALTGGRVIGLAETQVATEVLRDNGLTAINVSQFRDAQQRLDHGQAAREDWAWEVRSTDLVVIDESSMANSAAVFDIAGRVESAGGRLLLTGDHAQLAAVGAGGTMSMLTQAEGADVHALTEVRRFSNGWEASASLALRDGNKASLREYEARGRLRGCGTVEQAVAAAAAARVAAVLRGETSIIVTGSNEIAAQVNSAVRAQLAELGRVGPAVLTLRDGTEAGVGDLVQARQNDYGLMVTNRRDYVVSGVKPDGSVVLTATDGSGTRDVPAGYVAQHVTLGYAGTAHSAQGRTLDSAGVITHNLDRAGLYVGLTRGRDSNTAYVVTRDAEGKTVGSPRSVLADVVESERSDNRAALDQRVADALAARSMGTVLAYQEAAVRTSVGARTAAHLDEMAADGTLSVELRERLAGDPGTEQLGRLMRAVEQAGHNPRQALRDAVTSRSLDDARSPAQTLHYRITSSHVGEMSPRECGTVPAGIPDEYAAHLQQLADVAAVRAVELGTTVAADPPVWALETLGPVPTDDAERAAWTEKAGAVEAHREASGWESESEPIGLAPGLSTSEHRASWHAAWQALGRPERVGEEAELTEGQLRVRVRTWEREQRNAPPYRHVERSVTAEQLAAAKDAATIAAAQAEAATDQAERERLTTVAADHAARVERLEQRADRLEQVEDIRADWRADTAATAEIAHRAAVELSNRDRTIGEEPDRVTAAELLAADEQAKREDDPHRVVTPDDVRDQADEAEGLGEIGSLAESAKAAADTPEPATEAQDDADATAGVPTEAETFAAVAAAEIVADRLADRRSEEAAHAAAERDAASRDAAYRNSDRAAAAESVSVGDAAGM